jgi:hypothetical protein
MNSIQMPKNYYNIIIELHLLVLKSLIDLLITLCILYTIRESIPGNGGHEFVILREKYE